jgi:hypothetical protein
VGVDLLEIGDLRNEAVEEHRHVSTSTFLPAFLPAKLGYLRIEFVVEQ